MATVVSEIAPLQEPPKPLSPLKPHQIAEIFKEAQLVVYRINNEETEEGESRDNSESEAGRKRKSQTPLRHQRKGTFTESPDAFIRLPENVVKAMPVIDIEINDPFQSKVEENKENCTREVSSRLAPPRNGRLPGSQLTSKNKVRATQGPPEWGLLYFCKSRVSSHPIFLYFSYIFRKWLYFLYLNKMSYISYILMKTTKTFFN